MGDDSYIQPVSCDFYGASIKHHGNITKLVKLLSYFY